MINLTDEQTSAIKTTICKLMDDHFQNLDETFQAIAAITEVAGSSLATIHTAPIITDEMVERACEAAQRYYHGEAVDWPLDIVDEDSLADMRAAMRTALTAALTPAEQVAP